MAARAKPIRQDLEILRIAAAFGIVLFHSGQDTTGIGYGGLVVFLVLSASLAVENAHAGATIRQILTKRARRLLAPWAVWMILYGARNHFFADRNILETDRGWINGILAGTQIHLWYLPFLFAATTLLDLLVPRVPRKALGWIAGIVATGILATAPQWRPWAELHGYPTVQYCHAGAGLLIGVFLGCRSSLGTLSLSTLLGAVFAAIGWTVHREVVGVALPYLVGTLLAAGALVGNPRLPPGLDVRPVSRCMFGVYLGHIFFDRIYNVVPDLPDLAEPFLTFGSMLAVVWLFRRFLPRAASWAT